MSFTTPTALVLGWYTYTIGKGPAQTKYGIATVAATSAAQAGDSLLSDFLSREVSWRSNFRVLCGSLVVIGILAAAISFRARGVPGYQAVLETETDQRIESFARAIATGLVIVLALLVIERIFRIVK